MITFDTISLDNLTPSQMDFMKDIKSITDLKLKVIDLDYNNYIATSMSFQRYNLKQFLESFNIL